MTRILIIVFDALRPEFVTPELMPNLCGFATSGVWCRNHHSVFPTETRVNQSAVVTGCYPQRHGMVANFFPMPGAEGLLNTGDDPALETVMKGLPEPLFGVPNLGDILAAQGRSYASISAGKSGGARLINLNAEQNGFQRYALRRPEASMPPGLEREISDKVGPIPEYTRPAVAWNRHAVETWLEVMDPTEPDVSLVWLCEPDESFHWHGIGSPESLDAIRGVDAAFGEILERKADAFANGDLQIVTMSDHGQISLSGAKINLEDRMREAGFDLDGAPPEAIVYVHNGGGIWLCDNDPALIAGTAEWLLEQTFTGPVFTRDGLPGTLRHADIQADHPRAPDIYLALSHRDGTNAHGIGGLSEDNAPYPEGGGCHGGLSRYELHNFLALGGSAFRQAQNVSTPTGNVDILPTALNLLGIQPDHQIDGRPLVETFADPKAVAATTHETGNGRTRLQFSQIGDTRYLDRAWADLSQL